jgi:predicted nucleotidyltransferase
MVRHKSPNIQQVEIVACALGELAQEVVFVGGCVVALLVDEAAQSDTRATEDVDVVIEVTGHASYYEFAKKLKRRNFSEGGVDNPVICRWVATMGGARIVVDVMPTDPAILGFSNEWYIPAYREANNVRLPNDMQIKLVTPLLFLATKFTAWHSRANGDIYHKDMEDIVYVLEHRSRISVEFTSETNQHLRDFLRDEAQALLTNSSFLNALPGMVSTGSELAVVRTLQIIAKP